VLPRGLVWSIKVFPGNSSSTSTSDVICGLNEVSNNPAGVDAVNMSVAGLGDSSFESVRNEGIPVVVAAGNSGGSVQFPAVYRESIAVSALDNSNTSLASLSSRGPEIAMDAPGVNITSLIDSSPWCCSTTSGTSRVAPHVAAVAGLLKNQHPSWSVDDIVSALQAGGDCRRTRVRIRTHPGTATRPRRRARCARETRTAATAAAVCLSPSPATARRDDL